MEAYLNYELFNLTMHALYTHGFLLTKVSCNVYFKDGRVHARIMNKLSFQSI